MRFTRACASHCIFASLAKRSTTEGSLCTSSVCLSLHLSVDPSLTLHFCWSYSSSQNTSYSEGYAASQKEFGNRLHNTWKRPWGSFMVIMGILLKQYGAPLLNVKWHVAKFYGRLQLIRSVLWASKFSELKLIEIVILWAYYTIPFGFSLFRNFWSITFYLFKLLCLAKDHWRGFSTPFKMVYKTL